jgi:hypothetical protein
MTFSLVIDSTDMDTIASGWFVNYIHIFIDTDIYLVLTTPTFIQSVNLQLLFFGWDWFRNEKCHETSESPLASLKEGEVEKGCTCHFSYSILIEISVNFMFPLTSHNITSTSPQLKHPILSQHQTNFLYLNILILHPISNFPFAFQSSTNSLPPLHNE